MYGCVHKKDKQEYITLGALLPLTGAESDEGLRAFNGLQLAKKEINESGGVMGKMIDIITLNDRGEEDYAVQQYHNLRGKGVVAIIGSSYSGVTTAIAKASEKDGIPVISPTASDPGVTRGRKNVFRAIFTDDYQAKAMAYFAYNSLNTRNVLILINENFASYKRAAEVFEISFREYGGQIAAVEYYSAEEDYPGILAKYAINKPDLIFCPEDYLPAAKLINCVHEHGFEGVYKLGTDAWDGILTYVPHPEAMKNVYYSAPFSFDDPDEDVTRFVRNYFNIFSQMPLSGSATAYTCVYILKKAIEEAGNTNSHDIVSAMKKNVLDVITGRIQFDENNNPHTNVYVIQIDGGVYSTFEKLSL